MKKRILTFLTKDGRVAEVYIKRIYNKTRYEIRLKHKDYGLLDICGADNREGAYEIVEDLLATDLREGAVEIKGHPYYIVKFEEFLNKGGVSHASN